MQKNNQKSKLPPNQSCKQLECLFVQYKNKLASKSTQNFSLECSISTDNSSFSKFQFIASSWLVAPIVKILLVTYFWHFFTPMGQFSNLYKNLWLSSCLQAIPIFKLFLEFLSGVLKFVVASVLFDLKPKNVTKKHRNKKHTIFVTKISRILLQLLVKKLLLCTYVVKNSLRTTRHFSVVKKVKKIGEKSWKTVLITFWWNSSFMYDWRIDKDFEQATVESWFWSYFNTWLVHNHKWISTLDKLA